MPAGEPAMNDVAEYHDYLNPRPSANKLDLYVGRRALLNAVKGQLTRFHGTVLDIGCGSMPYKPLLLQPPTRVRQYIGVDLPDSGHGRADVEWDGRALPAQSASVDCAIATEVFEHCPEPEVVMREAWRVLKPGGFLFFTVPFLCPLHCSPNDQYRYTPFALQRHLRQAGFAQIEMKALGGWDASLAQMIGLWVRRRPMPGPLRRLVRSLLSYLALPLVRGLRTLDSPPDVYTDQTMITGISGTAVKPGL
jgi:SAM-dependent methyltransferase